MATNGFSPYENQSTKTKANQNRNKPSVNVPNDCDAEEEVVRFLLANITIKPKIGLICGSGLGSLADQITDACYFPYEKIPQFPVSTVKGHKGQLVVGYLANVPVICMQGRLHYFEGYTLNQCCMPVRVMHMLGVKLLIATNAAGGLNVNFSVGDIMLIKDHVNMMGFSGNNPLIGPNDDRFGPRFPSMINAYDEKLRSIAKDVAEKLVHSTLREGVYACVGGPNFETVAELKILNMMGVDAVGMSTVHEVITARHCGMKVFAFSLITNICPTDYKMVEDVNHEDVIDVGRRRETDLKNFISEIINKI